MWSIRCLSIHGRTPLHPPQKCDCDFWAARVGNVFFFFFSKFVFTQNCFTPNFFLSRVEARRDTMPPSILVSNQTTTAGKASEFDHVLCFQWTVYSTSGNRPMNSYHYRLYITTGLRVGAGTTSTVYLHLHGDLGDSGVRKLRAEQHNVFQVQTFVATPFHC